MIRNILVFCLVFRLVKAYDDRRAGGDGGAGNEPAGGGGGKTDLFWSKLSATKMMIKPEKDTKKLSKGLTHLQNKK